MSTPVASSEPFDPTALRDAEAVRRALTSAGFDGKNVAGFLQGAQPEKDGPLLRRRALAGGEPLHAAIRLFLLGMAVDQEALGRLLEQDQIAQLTAVGLLRRSDDGYRAVAQLAPAPEGTGWLASDFTLRLDQLADDHVLGVGAASNTLAALTPRRSFRRALDLGCGSGCQSLLAAAHCETVVGTDISARALNFAGFNARLNGVTNVEFRAGSFFEPVAGERFDLVVANPPFVISPENERIFRTGSAQGDRVSEQTVRQTPAFLDEGGVAVILLNWHHRTEEDWAERPVSWTEGNGCDSWLLRFDSSEPLVYAAEWLRTEGKTSDAMARALDRWEAYYQRLGIERISAGVLVLRRRTDTGRTWTRADALTFGKHTGNCGAHVERVIAGETCAQEMADADLLAARFRLHPAHLVDTHLRCEAGGWVQGPVTLRPQPGLEFSGRLDGPLMQVLSKLDGTCPLGAVLDSCARALDLQVSVLREAGIGAVHKLLRAGFLESLEEGGEGSPVPPRR